MIYPSGKYPVFGGNGIRGFSSTFNHDGDFALIGRQGALCGNISWSSGKAYFTEHAVAVQADEDQADTKFMYYQLGIMNLGQYSGQSAQPGLAVNKIIKLESSFPSKEEQHKIGSFFTKLDNTITLQQRKLNSLQKLKKGLLQKMFPKNGENIPEIRFPEFSDAWKQRKLSELYVKISEKNDLTFGPDKIISVANMYFKEDSKESSVDYMKTYNIMRMGDIAFEGNKSKNYAHGRFVENTIGDGIVSHVFDVFRPIVKYDLNYWKYFINNEKIMGRIMARCTKASTMMTNLVAKDFLRESIAVPTFNEQAKIGSFFFQLDSAITLQQRWLFYTHKQS